MVVYMKNSSKVKIENNNILSIISKNMKHFRTLKNISQVELGLRSELSPNYITDIEMCKKDIKVTTLAKIAAGLEISPQELLVDNREVYKSKLRIDKKKTTE